MANNNDDDGNNIKASSSSFQEQQQQQPSSSSSLSSERKEKERNKKNEKRKMGLAAVNAETLKRIVMAGGKARAKDIESLRAAGRLGGRVVRETYGSEFYSQIGTKGSKTLIERYTITYFTDLAAKSKAARKKRKNNEKKKGKKL